MNVASTEGSTSLDITLNTKFKNDVKLLRASLVMPFLLMMQYFTGGFR